MIKKSIKAIIKFCFAAFFAFFAIIVIFSMIIYKNPTEISIFSKYLGSKMGVFLPQGIKLDVESISIYFDDNLRLNVDVLNFKLISQSKTELSTSGLSIILDPIAVFPQRHARFFNISISNPAIINGWIRDSDNISHNNSALIKRISQFIKEKAHYLVKFAISINDIDIEFKKHNHLSTIRLHQLTIQPLIEENVLLFDVYGDIDIGKKNNTLTARINPTLQDQISANIKVTKFSNATLKEFGIDLPVLHNTNVEVDLDLHAIIKSFRNIEYLGFKVTNYYGDIMPNDVINRKIDIRELDVEGYCNNTCSNVYIEKLKIIAPQLEINGTADIIANDIDNILKTDLTILGLDVKMLEYYWPDDFIKRTRDWVFSHIKDGEIKSANAKLTLDLNEIKLKNIQNSDFNIAMQLENAAIKHIHTDSVIDNINAKIDIINDNIKFYIQEVFVKNALFEEVYGEVANVSSADSYIMLKFNTFGEISDLIASSAEYVDLQALKQYKVSGYADGALSVKFPLEELKSRDLMLQGKINAKNATIYDVFKTQHITDSDITMTFDSSNINATGKGVFLDSDINFDVKYGIISGDMDAKISSDVSIESLKKHIAIPSYISGNSLVKFSIRNKKKVISYNMDADLLNTSVVYEKFNINKDVGINGTLSADIRKEGDKYIIDKYAFEIPNLHSNGSGGFDFDRHGVHLVSDSTTFFKGNFKFKYFDGIGERKLKIYGKSFDVTFFSPHLYRSHNHIDGKFNDRDNVRLSVDLDVDKIYMHNNVIFNQSHLDLLMDGSAIKKASFAGYFDDKEEISLNIDGDMLDLSIANAGAFFRAMDFNDRIKNGVLIASGSLNGNNFDGKIHITDYIMHKAPVLTKLLSLLSFSSISSIISMLSTNGMQFDRLECPIKINSEAIYLDSCITTGPSLSLTASGYVNINSRTLDIKGSVAPQNIISSTLKYIPFIGDSLLSKKDGSLFGASYTIFGPIEDPVMKANPLSLFVPSIFRDAVGNE